MMSYLSVEWRKTKKFSMLMIGICLLAFCSLDWSWDLLWCSLFYG